MPVIKLKKNLFLMKWLKANYCERPISQAIFFLMRCMASEKLCIMHSKSAQSIILDNMNCQPPAIRAFVFSSGKELHQSMFQLSEGNGLRPIFECGIQRKPECIRTAQHKTSVVQNPAHSFAKPKKKMLL